MTKNFIKRYNITLKTIGPVFIGSGEKLTSKEYIYNPREKKIIVVDKKKLMDEVLKSDRLEEFVEYFNGTNTRGLDRNKQVRLLDWRGLKDKISSIEYHSYDASHLPKNVNDIELFIKDPLTGKPYIPGSSLKGAIRTILANKYIAGHWNDFEEERGSITKTLQNNKDSNSLKEELKEIANSIETKVFNRLKREEKKKGDARNDMLSAVRISDSGLVELDDLMINQKIDVLALEKYINDTGKIDEVFMERRLDKEKNNISTFKECIKPGTEIYFELSTDASVYDFNNFAKTLNDGISNNTKDYNEKFVSKFPIESGNEKNNVRIVNDGISRIDRFRMQNKPVIKSNNIFYLGGGAGFHTKTILLSLFDKDWFEPTRDILHTLFPSQVGYGKNRSHHDKYDKVAPHTIKMGENTEVGKCEIGIIEIE